MNMSGRTGTKVKAALLIAALGALGATVMVLNKKKQTVDMTVRQIEDAISALDPASRAAVVGRLTAEAVDNVKVRISG